MRFPSLVPIILIVFFSLTTFIFADTGTTKPKRPFYEYKGDYRGNIDLQKKAFKESFSYELMDLDIGWKPREIETIHKAFSQLPPILYGVKGLNGLYRTAYLQARKGGGILPEEVPAATFPAFTSIYRENEKSYNIYVEDETLRIEFYNPLFFESEKELINIIHHEFGHAYDMSHGMLSVSLEWLNITKFRILHLPPLDAQEKGDFLFTFINNHNVARYAPTALRQQGSYSLQNPQEDFANSFAAYIHYPYFKYSNPERYEFLKNKVFGGKDYFPAKDNNLNYIQAVTKDLNQALNSKNWGKLGQIALEVSRLPGQTESDLVIDFFKKALQVDSSKASIINFAEKSCFILTSSALEFRKDLARKKLFTLKDILGENRCKHTARQPFEKGSIKFPVSNVFFYRENDSSFVQFIDSIAPQASARGYGSKYIWTLSVSNGGKVLGRGEKLESSGMEPVRIKLNDSLNQGYKIPFGKKLTLKIEIKRTHPRTFKVFDSSATKIQFISQPWILYFPNGTFKPRVIYPLSQLHLEKN